MAYVVLKISSRFYTVHFFCIYYILMVLSFRVRSNFLGIFGIVFYYHRHIYMNSMLSYFSYLMCELCTYVYVCSHFLMRIVYQHLICILSSICIYQFLPVLNAYGIC